MYSDSSKAGADSYLEITFNSDAGTLADGAAPVGVSLFSN